MTRIGIIGGGPAGYEAAMVAAQLGADVTIVDRDGIGGACVLTDCVPSKTLIATSNLITRMSTAGGLGVSLRGPDGLTRPMSWEEGGSLPPPDFFCVDMGHVCRRVLDLASAQSRDIEGGLSRAGVRVVRGEGLLISEHSVVLNTGARVEADFLLFAVGTQPRVIHGLEPDGNRVVNWTQIYNLPGLPEHLIVVGSGVTGVEFASAFRALGSRVTLVSSRERVLPGEDPDAAEVIEDVFRRRGIKVISQTRAVSAQSTPTGAQVGLNNGRTIEGSHALLAIGSVPRTHGIGLEPAGVRLDRGGYIGVDRVSRTSVPSIYAAGDCTGVLPLASVAAMQGRIAMWHALGEAVQPLRLDVVSSSVFTDPEVASVGVAQAQVDKREVTANVVKLPLSGNARAKMQGLRDGFVKIMARPGTGTVLGGVVVSPRASELILAVTIAVQNALTVEQLAHTFAIYPSMSGSITEAARQLMGHGPGPALH